MAVADRELEREFWVAVRRALLAICAAIKKRWIDKGESDVE